MLQSSAAHAGRTVSGEIEHRLEESYLRDQMQTEFLGSEKGAEILKLIRLAMVNEGGLDWGWERHRAENVRVAANAIIAVICRLPLELPPPEKRTKGLLEARHLLRKSFWGRRLPAELWALKDSSADEDSAPPSGGND
jgi:hypothetical protein